MDEEKKRSQQNAEKKGLTLAELTQKYEREMQEYILYVWFVMRNYLFIRKIDRSKEPAKNIQE